MAYLGGDGGAFGLEDLVKVTGGDVVCDGDAGWSQLRVVQVLADECLDAQGKGPPVSLGRQGSVRAEDVGEECGHQIGQDCSQAGSIAGLVGTGVFG